MMPTSAAAIEVIMNRPIFTRLTGTPTLRAATLSPPTPKIQLPTRVRISTQVASAVITIHQITLMRKLCGDQKSLAKIRCALSNPATSRSPLDAHRVGDRLRPAEVDAAGG